MVGRLYICSHAGIPKSATIINDYIVSYRSCYIKVKAVAKEKSIIAKVTVRVVWENVM